MAKTDDERTASPTSSLKKVKEEITTCVQVNVDRFNNPNKHSFMKKTHLIAGFMVALVLTLVTTSSTFAFFGKQNRNFDPEKHEKMQQVMENKDFEGWKTLEMETCQTRVNKMTKEDFQNFAEKHLERGQNMEAMRNAMETGDYNAWKEAMGNNPGKGKMMENVDEATFTKMVEAHKLMQAGDIEGAKTIQGELGLQKGFHGHKKGFRFQK